jgi:hypothetical protein
MARQTYTEWRREFIARLQSEGVSEARARVILANANKLQRIAVDDCSNEAAYLRLERERASCVICFEREPEARTYVGISGAVRRVCTEHKAERAILDAAKGQDGITSVNFSGDPRGCVVKLRMNSERGDSWGDTRDLCVPCREY